MLILDGISLSLGGKKIIEDLSTTIRNDQRVALAGRNGSGKSTLLKVIAGIIKPDEGSVAVSKDTVVAYMPQELSFSSKKPVAEEAMTVFEKLFSEKRELEVLLAELEGNGQKDVGKLVERVGVLSARLSDVNFEKLRDESKKVLMGLGFSDRQMGQATDTLSAGWKMRLVLAKLLLTKADFYLFDEPTNHLDIVAKDWFLKFIKQSSFGFLLISHDRYFLDELCEYTIDMDQHPNKLYTGNYTKFRYQREQEIEALRAAAANQEKMIKAKMATVERFRAKSSKAKMAQSMLKELDKIERIKIPHEHKVVRIGLPHVKRSGRVVLTVKNLEKSFDEKVFKNVSFELMRGEKVALVAANGKGKTTLLQCIIGQIKSDAGKVVFGHNVEPSFFEQDQDKVLDPQKSILDEVENSCVSSEQRSRVRGLLGAFLFPGDDVHKKIGVLSGGEKNRVAMVKTLITNKNFLILDEPTNHLDLQSKEILLKALQEFDGTILFVSHDRSFLDDLSMRTLELSQDGLRSYDGNYESYVYQKSTTQQVEKEVDTAKMSARIKSRKKLSGKEQHEIRKQLGKTERLIEKLEQELEKLHIKLGSFSYGTEAYNTTHDRITKLKRDLDAANMEWEDLMGKI